MTVEFLGPVAEFGPRGALRSSQGDVNRDENE